MKQNGNSSNIAVVNCKQHACIMYHEIVRNASKHAKQTAKQTLI